MKHKYLYAIHIKTPIHGDDRPTAIFRRQFFNSANKYQTRRMEYKLTQPQLKRLEKILYDFARKDGRFSRLTIERKNDFHETTLNLFYQPLLTKERMSIK